MSISKRIQDKRKSDKVRRMRNTASRHQGATSWKEKKEHTNRVSGVFGSSIGKWFMQDGWAVIGIALLIVGSLGYYFFYSPSQRVSTVQVLETQFIDRAAVQEYIEDTLNQKKFFFLPGNSLVTISEEKLALDVESSFGENYALESVDITFDGTAMTVDVSERVPSVTWVAKGGGKNERVYTVDQNGVVTSEIASRKEANSSYPLIVDRNRENLGIDWQVIAPEYIAFIMDMHTTFTDTTGYAVRRYDLPKIECHTKEYQAEEVFEKEIENEESQEAKDLKREVQERFQRGEITIDESIELLEQINSTGTETPDSEINGSQGNIERIEFEAVNTPTECDLVKVAHDLYLQAEKPGNDDLFAVRFDVTQEAANQLQHVLTVLRTQIDDVQLIDYIDVRIPDRVYYQ
jgi:hypothetical protein